MPLRNYPTAEIARHGAYRSELLFGIGLGRGRPWFGHWDTIVTSADLALQRERFALDGAADRPYHSIAHARHRRGLPVFPLADMGRRGYFRHVLDTDPDKRGWSRVYRSEEPFLRSIPGMHADSARWAEALRRNRNAT